jgi:hypothetical protein
LAALPPIVAKGGSKYTPTGMATVPKGDTIETVETPVTPRRTQETTSESPAAGSKSHGGSAVVEKKEAAEEVEEEGEQEEEDEPRLKYHRLTGSLNSVYRSGDATSSFLVSGDKMVCVTPDVLLSTTNDVYRYSALIMAIS